MVFETLRVPAERDIQREPTPAQSTRRVLGVLRHVLANGSASFQSCSNYIDHFRPYSCHHGIQDTKDLRTETGPFGFSGPSAFTCAKPFFHLARGNVFGMEILG